MLKNESIWIKQKLSELNISNNTKILNFGSQSKKKLVYQPFFRRNVLAYILDRRAKIINFDIEDSEGVDIFGDILDVSVFKKLKEMEFDIVLLNNVLEHVDNIKGICERIELILPAGSNVLFTGPYKYPVHLDPIDNLFRPRPEDLIKLFYQCRVLSSSIVKEINYFQKITSNFSTFIIEVTRILTPFYKFNKWRSIVVPKWKWLFKSFEVTVAFIEKK